MAVIETIIFSLLCICLAVVCWNTLADPATQMVATTLSIAYWLTGLLVSWKEARVW